MIKTRIFLYNSQNESNGYRGEELTDHLLQADYLKEDITEALDVGEITLAGLTRREEFEPETKFIIDIYDVRKRVYEEEEFEEIVDEWHWDMCVQKDLVEQPILSDDTYFNHSISLIEPSVIAQKRLVDNISATYKLKDVNLETQPTFNINQESQTQNSPSIYTPTANFGNYSSGFLGYYTNSIWGKHFLLDGAVQMLTRAQSSSGSTKLYQEISNYDVSGNQEYYAKFKIPKVKIYFGVQGGKTFSYIGDASLHYVIQEFNLSDYYNPTNTWEGDFISNSNLSTGDISTYPLNLSGQTTPSQYNRAEWLVEKADFISNGVSATTSHVYVRRYTDTSQNTPDYLTQEIEILPNKRYAISISLKEFEDSFSVVGGGSYIGAQISYLTSTKDTPIQKSKYWKGALEANRNFEFIQFAESQLTASCSFQTYESSGISILLQSANPYSALSLLQKAIINSQMVKKQPNVYIGDVNNMTNLPFYIDEDWLTELQNTQVIEMFYNQKNLWEVLVEIGKYVHAIPKITFGTDNRFKISFDKLGETKEYTNKNYKASIMNFRGVDDYVSACSSYVTNMVQLDGYIDEWVAPKTTDEQMLVYNDTCSIIVSKPIIEILKVDIKCIDGSYSFATVGQTVDMTEYIYESNVYNLLSIDPNEVPSKAVAINYKLGTNEIVGCSYKTPTVNSGDPQDDYSIKKIIYCAFNGGVPANFGSMPSQWANIKVNDFVFHVVYRTKDSVRQDQSRPDLKKYLLSSIKDEIPQHNQFNNQTDVVVDSNKFGNNIYGKLIRTGNTNFVVTEWTDNLADLKHKGELYNIDGELYYVATAKHTFYVSHIESEIEYSKNYNQLSQIIGIPSEPRFYEISEQSLINREFVINDYFILSNSIYQFQNQESAPFLRDPQTVADLIFGGENADFARYAITTFKGDKDIDPNEITQGSNEFYKDVITPLNAYSSQNTLTYEWDMVDNFSAGDKVDQAGTTQTSILKPKAADNAYKSLKAVQYTDIYGKAPLLDFYILKELPDLTAQEIQQMPESPIRTRVVGRDGTENAKPFIGDEEIEPLVIASNVSDFTDTNYNGRGLGLLKDCREKISINYNTQLLVDTDYPSHYYNKVSFVLSPNVFVPNKKNVRLVLLKDEVNKLNNGLIDTSSIIMPKGDGITSQYFTFTIENFVDTYSNICRLNLRDVFADVNANHFGDNNHNDVEGYERVKAIAVVYDIIEPNTETGVDIPYKAKLVAARNIDKNLNKFNALEFWILQALHKTTYFFNNYQ